jgi:hypothetical protein
MSGHGWKPGDERKKAIADLANAMQAVAGVVDAMTRDELESLLGKLDAMHSIILRNMAAPRKAPGEGVVRDIGSGLHRKGRV